MKYCGVSPIDEALKVGGVCFCAYLAFKLGMKIGKEKEHEKERWKNWKTSYQDT